MSETSLLPRAHGAAVLSAAMRSTPDDFQVDELPAFEPSGEGEHLLLTVRKRGQNTAYIAKKLAHWAGIAEMGVSYAGLKDRHAVTTQRFSVHLPKRIAPYIAALDDAEMQVVDSTWHNRKLQRGALHGNRFVLTLRQVQGERDAVDHRLQAIAARGIPNWFGEQRFLRSTDQAATVEQGALSDPQSEALRQGLEAAGLKQERRALRLRPQGLDYRWLEAQTLQLEFALPPGCYATAVLWELGEVTDAGRFNVGVRSDE
ncbi:tRNA pseudouridine(13) synthase TruD [Xanthomonas vasicola]|nr:tRNA pseudouridine(13) synthase TruD [Xanthomonas vasicola]